jgi:hypothetical protein
MGINSLSNNFFLGQMNAENQQNQGKNNINKKVTKFIKISILNFNLI